MSDRSHPRIWTTRTFDRLSKYYDTFMQLFFPIGEKGRERIVERLKTGSLLDVGCGTGTLLGLASQKGMRCFGIDLSSGMLDRSQAKAPDADRAIASFYHIPFPNDCFDYVVATNALSGTFINSEEALGEMVRVCKKSGHFLIAEWPASEHGSINERILVKLASLNDDAPKDYLKIFRDLCMEPGVDHLDKRYAIFSGRKA